MLIEGKIGLRSVEANDLDQLKNWRNLREFRRYFREYKELNSIDQKKWFEKITKSNNDFMFSIIELESDKLIGACGLLYINWIIRSADFSFYIGKDSKYIENNYSFDSANCLISYGFNCLNLNKIWMELYEFDTKKINFFKNELGFKVDGKLRENCFENGKYWDSLLLSKIKSDF